MCRGGEAKVFYSWDTFSAASARYVRISRGTLAVLSNGDIYSRPSSRYYLMLRFMVALITTPSANCVAQCHSKSFIYSVDAGNSVCVSKYEKRMAGRVWCRQGKRRSRRWSLAARKPASYFEDILCGNRKLGWSPGYAPPPPVRRIH